MMTYSMTCTDGHEPEVLTVQAMNDEEAMTKMLPKSKAHLDTRHPGMSMTEEQSRAFISSHWAKS